MQYVHCTYYVVLLEITAGKICLAIDVNYTYVTYLIVEENQPFFFYHSFGFRIDFAKQLFSN